MSTPALPEPVARLAADLRGLPGAVAIVLGGSRATGTQRPDSDWDLGLYYRAGTGFDPDLVRRLGHDGHVSELGEWGPIMHGGAWLTLAGTPVDVIFRELDRVENWLENARRGDFEVKPQNGYIVGAPTYVPVGELALCRVISGRLPRPSYPDALAATASERWHARASLSLMFARAHAAAGDVVACVGMLAQAVLCVAHARLARRHEWVLNEKRLVRRAGLDDVHAALAHAGTSSAELISLSARVADMLELTPFASR
jgi:predicted nucleotidyltransferase